MCCLVIREWKKCSDGDGDVGEVMIVMNRMRLGRGMGTAFRFGFLERSCCRIG